MDAVEMTDLLVNWLREQVEAAKMKGLIFGLSGGIDSAVVAALCKRAFPDNSMGIIMDIHSNPQDAEHAKLVAEKLELPVKRIILDDVFDLFCTRVGADPATDGKLNIANIKPRLRMTSLYYYAGKYNYLVAGTGNRCEYTVGYFTKYGDGGVDLMPIVNLVKDQVYYLARYLGIPQEVIDKAPSAGLWEDQTDEAEMGISYEQLDRYLLTGEAEDYVKEKVARMEAISEHKKRLPAKPPVFK